MTHLKLTNQKATSDAVDNEFKKLKKALEDRKDIWAKMSKAKKKVWLDSGLDPVLNLSLKIYEYLDKNFFGEVR